MKYLDALVYQKVKDEAKANIIINFFEKELKQEDKEAVIHFESLAKYDDILTEFIECLTKKTYNLENAISVEGFSAKQISELSGDFNPQRVYSFFSFIKR